MPFKKPTLSPAQLAGLQAMASAGVPPGIIAEVLGIESSLLPKIGEYRTGQLESSRLEKIERLFLRPKGKVWKAKKGLSKKTAFLEAYVASRGSITDAAEAIGIERGLHYRWLKEDPEYPAAFTEAKERATDLLEDEGIRRGANGVLQPIFYQGVLVGHELEHSDSMLQCMLKARRPEEFNRNRHEVTGKDGAPFLDGITVTFVDAAASEEPASE